MSGLPTAQRLVAPTRESPTSAFVLERALLGLAFFAAVAVPVCRGIVPGLFGLSTGIGRFIQVSEQLSAWFTQALVWSALFVLCSLLSLGLRTSSLGILQRLVTLPVVGIAAVLVTFAATAKLDPRVNLSLVCAVSAVLFAGGSSAIRQASTRALGLGLIALGLGAGLQVAALSTAFNPAGVTSARALAVAQVLATLSFGVELGAVGLAVLAALRNRPRREYGAVALALAFAVALVWGAARGQAPGAPMYSTLASNALRELGHAPFSLVPERATQTFVVFAHTFALLVLFKKLEPAWAAPVLSLCVISVGASDVPAISLLCITAGLATLFLMTAHPLGSAGTEPAETS